jgi:peptidoglycan glycosyltransferase
MVACFALIVVQLVNIQLVRAPALADSPYNPRVSQNQYDNARGTIYAADGEVLAQSVKPSAATAKTTGYKYDYTRSYPTGNVTGGNIYAGIIGYDSPRYYGTAGLEEEYNSYLEAQPQSDKTLSQIIFRQKLPDTTDNVSLTIEPSLQEVAWNALNSVPGASKDGAVVVLDPSTGAVLAMVSNPIYDNNAMVNPNVDAEKEAYFSYIVKDHEGFQPLIPFATGQIEAPGSTFKVVTSTAAYNLKPSLDNFNYPFQTCQTFPAGGKALCDQSGPCGGTMLEMLPQSCDPGYGELGIQEGDSTLAKQAALFGIGSVPGIDLPSNNDVVASKFSDIPNQYPANNALLAYSAIGQDDDEMTALQNAMDAAAIANDGVIMTPHLMSEITSSQGGVIERYTPKAMPRTATSKAAQNVTLDMLGVATHGTAQPVGFPSYLCAAVKTGTAQTAPTVTVTDDWMIGFAPANDPKIAVAVVVPNQYKNSDGADIAGPIMKAVMEAAIPKGSADGCTGADASAAGYAPTTTGTAPPAATTTTTAPAATTTTTTAVAATTTTAATTPAP